MLPCLAGQLIPCSALLSTPPALSAVMSASLLAYAPARKLQPPTLPQGTPGVHAGREGGWAGQETIASACGNRGRSRSITPSSCGPPGETPSGCTGMHLPPPIASATVPQPAKQWDFSRVPQSTNMHLSFPTCSTLLVLPLLLLNPSFSALLGTPFLTHWVLTAAAG